MKISILLVLTILLVYVDMTYSSSHFVKPGTPDEDKPAVSHTKPVRPGYKPQGSKSDYTISLRGGNKPSHRHFYSQWFQWMKPLGPGIGGPCSWQGVIRTIQPPWANSFEIYMEFLNSYKYSFHIGDSPYNRGWGWFQPGTFWWNSEMFSRYRRYVLYANHFYSPASGRRRAYLANHIMSKAKIIIRANQVKFYPYFGSWHVYTIPNRLFRFQPWNYIRIGLNRIIQNEAGAPVGGRVGRGLCYIRLTWRSW